jgi:predicted alpha/beta superfamily hydrolase
MVDLCAALDTLIDELADAADDGARWMLVDDFIAGVQYSEHGFPMRCEDRAAFVVRDPGGATVSVAGDFNDWDESTHPLQPAVDGFPFHYVFVDEPLDAGLYKLVYDGTAYVADPLARRYGWDEFGEYSLTAARPDASHHERWPDFADGVGALQPRPLEVYVPAGAFDRDALPVLYMHDGQNLFSPDAFFGGWEASLTADALIEAGTVEPFLIVGIHNTPDRLDEYTHVQDDIGRAVGGRSDEYADYVVDGIKPFIDERYPTNPDPEATGVAGSSLGGLISLYIGQRHRDVFGHAASMSGTLGWGSSLGNEIIAEVYEGDAPDGLVLYIDSGGNGPCPNGGFDNYCSNVDFADRVRALGWTDEADLFYRWDPGALHNEAAWAARFGDMLAAWFPGS